MVAALRVAMDTCTLCANHAWLHHIKAPSPSSSIGDEFNGVSVFIWCLISRNMVELGYNDIAIIC